MLACAMGGAARYTATIVQFTVIAATPERVWRALTDPACVVVWDVGVVGPIDPPPDYPRPGQVVRWRYSLSGLPLTLIDEPQEVVPLQRLHTRIELGFLRFDETYTLDAIAGDVPRTRLSARLDVGNSLPLGGRAFDHWVGRRLAARTVAASLRAIGAFCEQDGRAEPGPV
jgi:hypothetical protein